MRPTRFGLVLIAVVIVCVVVVALAPGVVALAAAVVGGLAALIMVGGGISGGVPTVKPNLGRDTDFARKREVLTSEAQAHRRG